MDKLEDSEHMEDDWKKAVEELDTLTRGADRRCHTMLLPRAPSWRHEQSGSHETQKSLQRETTLGEALYEVKVRWGKLKAQWA